MFHDFHQKNIQYHSDLFWERVAQAWDDDVYGDEHDDLWGTVFGQDRNSFEIGFEDDGIVLLTKGYSWHWNFSNDLTLYEYFYRNVPGGVKSNMHDMANRKMTKSVFLVNQLVNEKNGLANTRHLADECGQKHNHPAAKACDYTAFPGNNTFSKAFLPSTGQWILAMRGMGMAWDDELGFGNENNENRNQQREEQQIAHVKQLFENAGTELSTTRSYWTSTKYDGSYVNLFTIDYQVLMGRPMYGSADKTRNALPFIAFKYDGGATED